MRTSRVLLGSLGSAAAAVALVAAVAVPAGAAGPFVVKAGTKTTGTTPLSGATVGASPQIQFSASGVDMSCDSGTASGSLKLGNNATGKSIASITGTTFNNCIGPAGLQMTVTQTGTWRLNATGPVRTNKSLPGQLAGISATVSTANPQQCSFKVTGTVNGTFTQNPTTNQLLKVGGTAPSNLTLSQVVGCFGLLANGDKAKFTASYKVTTTAGVVSITNG